LYICIPADARAAEQAIMLAESSELNDEQSLLLPLCNTSTLTEIVVLGYLSTHTIGFIALSNTEERCFSSLCCPDGAADEEFTLSKEAYFKSQSI